MTMTMTMTASEARLLLKKHAAAYGDTRYEPALWVIEAMQEASKHQTVKLLETPASPKRTINLITSNEGGGKSLMADNTYTNPIFSSVSYDSNSSCSSSDSSSSSSSSSDSGCGSCGGGS